MKLSNSKTSALSVLNIIWLIISIPLVLWFLWTMGLTKAYNLGQQKGFLRGRIMAYDEVIKAANNEKCAPFPVDYDSPSGEKLSLTLVNIACLQKATASQKKIQQSTKNKPIINIPEKKE